MDYKGPIEVALSTDLRGEPYNFALWDIYTGAQLIAFKGTKSSPLAKCLQLIDNNYFITANDNVLHIWSIFNRKAQEQKLFLPSRPSSLCVSPCGQYLIAGISESIYIWHVKSGNLLTHAQRHYQPICVLKMNHDGTILFSAGEDGMVLVWPFADLLAATHNTCSLNQSNNSREIGANEPRFTWQHHSAPITDLHATNSGRCVTVSVDQTLNIYSFTDGKRLFSIMMPSPLHSVVMDKNETSIYLGGLDGKIYEVAVTSLSLSLINSKNQVGQETKPTFVGHQGKVVSLVVSSDSTRLISASQDSSCKIWDIRQKKLLQDIKHQAPLANLKTLFVPDGFAIATMSKTQQRPPLTYKPLKRSFTKVPQDSAISKDDIFDESSTILVYIRNKSNLWLKPKPEDSDYSSTGYDQNCYDNLGHERRQAAKHLLASEAQNGNSRSDQTMVQSLKRKIQELYTYSAEKIFKDAAHDSYLSSYKDL